MNAAKLSQHCRTTRQGVPEGDIRDPRVLADVLTMLLNDRLEELAERAQPPAHFIQRSDTGGLAPTVPAQRAPDPREDPFACQLATLIGFVQDAGR